MAEQDRSINLKNFDPKTFWPAITPRSDSLSIYPSSSVSEARARRPSLERSDSYIEEQRQRNKTIIWIISISFFIIIAIMIAVFAWLGSHNWFKNGND
ncbi:hypothetical protein N7G274_005187 [Stereocaulon virgatum]|uniref:Uncharacterized protein n=1 Tax=Stereocaulon virgatum TaxID=373712 RepID=A0ABR4A7W9_9LECA